VTADATSKCDSYCQTPETPNVMTILIIVIGTGSVVCCCGICAFRVVQILEGKNLDDIVAPTIDKYGREKKSCIQRTIDGLLDCIGLEASDKEDRARMARLRARTARYKNQEKVDRAERKKQKAAAEAELAELAELEFDDEEQGLKAEDDPSVGLLENVGSTCPRCGNVFLPDAKFCRKCGKKRELPQEEVVQDDVNPDSIGPTEQSPHDGNVHQQDSQDQEIEDVSVKRSRRTVSFAEEVVTADLTLTMEDVAASGDGLLAENDAAQSPSPESVASEEGQQQGLQASNEQSPSPETVASDEGQQQALQASKDPEH